MDRADQSLSIGPDVDDGVGTIVRLYGVHCTSMTLWNVAQEKSAAKWGIMDVAGFELEDGNLGFIVVEQEHGDLAVDAILSFAQLLEFIATTGRSSSI